MWVCLIICHMTHVFALSHLFIPSAPAQTSLPWLARFGSRGNCGSMMSDVSAFELYTVYNVNSDPWATIQAVKDQLRSESDTG